MVRNSCSVLLSTFIRSLDFHLQSSFGKELNSDLRSQHKYPHPGLFYFFQWISDHGKLLWIWKVRTERFVEGVWGRILKSEDLQQLIAVETLRFFSQFSESTLFLLLKHGISHRTAERINVCTKGKWITWLKSPRKQRKEHCTRKKERRQSSPSCHTATPGFPLNVVRSQLYNTNCTVIVCSVHLTSACAIAINIS